MGVLCSMKSRMFWFSERTEFKESRRTDLQVRTLELASTKFSQKTPLGVK